MKFSIPTIILAISCVTGLAAAETPPAKPNILFLFADDWGDGHALPDRPTISALQRAWAPYPHLHRILRFQQAGTALPP